MNSLCCVCACGKNLGVRGNGLSLSLRPLFGWLNVFSAELSVSQEGTSGDRDPRGCVCVRGGGGEGREL